MSYIFKLLLWLDFVVHITACLIYAHAEMFGNIPIEDNRNVIHGALGLVATGFLAVIYTLEENRQ